jgi:N-acetylglucosamine-6-sulfatase
MGMKTVMKRVLSFGAIVGAALVVGLTPAPRSTAAEAPQPRPNIVVIMADDQTVESMRVMANVNAMLGEQGTTFADNYVSFPLCCPSRTTLLTGQYGHNHTVMGNAPPQGGYEKLAPTHANTLPAWLKLAGYHTVHVGKYLNGYGRQRPTEVPPGWDEWFGSVDPSTYRFYDYTLNENGKLVRYGTGADDYQADVYTAKAVDAVKRLAGRTEPFFLSVAYLAPHSGGPRESDDPANLATPVPAPRHRNRFAGEPLPRTPAFNEADVSDKPLAVRRRPLLGTPRINGITEMYRQRLESLLAVDEGVAAIVRALQDSGELSRTLFVYTSDNGFFHGEHRVRNGKVRLYEPSIRVPLIIRGPGVPKGKRRSQPAANIDLAPTILDFANGKARRVEDGRSLVPLIEDGLLDWGRAIVIEAFFNADPGEDPETPDTNFQAVRTDRYLFARYGTGESELYDLQNDPFELQSRHNDPALAPVQASLDRLLAGLKSCAGKSCRSRPALKLKLEFRNGGGCVASGVQARITGGSAGQVQSAGFFARGKAGQDGSAPFERKIGADELSRSHKNRIRAIAMMLDGRLAGVQATTPPRC